MSYRLPFFQRDVIYFVLKWCFTAQNNEKTLLSVLNFPHSSQTAQSIGFNFGFLSAFLLNVRLFLLSVFIQSF